MNFGKDITGKWRPIVKQERGYSCGPACVKMISYLVNNIELGEDFTRASIIKAEGNLDTSLGLGGVVVEGARDFNRMGTWNICEGIDALRPLIRYEIYTNGGLMGLGGIGKIKSSARDINVLSRTTIKKPAIINVNWRDGGAHWIVIAGRLNDTNFLVLDPWYGVQYVRVNPIGGFFNYTPRDNAGIVLAYSVWGDSIALVI
ncbi:TPA: hypothetical protein QH850_001300 [Enterobacter chengduensis]|nr:hypothetical protein [Enterobacter chengduensis]